MSAKHIFHSLQKPVEVTFTSPKLLPTSDGKKGVCVAKRPGGVVEVGQLAWPSEPGWATVSSPVERYVVEQVPTAIPEKDVRGGTSTSLRDWLFWKIHTHTHTLVFSEIQPRHTNQAAACLNVFTRNTLAHQHLHPLPFKDVWESVCTCSPHRAAFFYSAWSIPQL